METTQKTARRYLAPGYKAEALALAGALDGNHAGMFYAGSVVVEPRYWDAAHACGLARTLIKKIRGRAAHEARGADDERIDTEGALAELLIALVLEKSGASIAALVAHKPDSGGVDITLGDKRIDVKSVGQGRQFININCKQHEEKAAAVYCIVHFVRADIADIWGVAAEAVSSWKQNTFLRGAPLDPRRYYFSSKLPSFDLEALPEEAEAA